MSALEQRYNKLLAWYPEPFRSEQAGEMLGVLMAGAEQGQQRPRPREYADVLKSALRMRLRTPRSAAWVDALAGLRWLALAAVVAASVAGGIAISTSYFPFQLQVIAASFGMLEAASHYQPFPWRTSLGWGSVAVSCALTGVAIAVAVAAKLGWHFPLLLTALCYAYALILATTPPASSGSDLIGSPTPMHLTLLFVPSLLIAAYCVITSMLSRLRPPRPVTVSASHLSQS
jgi:hypothetical protein